MTIPLVRVRYMRDHARAYRDLGGDPDSLIRRIGMHPAVLESPEALLPLSQLEALTQHAIRDTSFALGWSAAARRLTDLGSFGRRLSTAMSLSETVAMFPSAVLSEISGARFFLERRRDRLWICHGPFSGNALLRTHAERFHVQTLLTVIRHWTGPGWFPEELWLQTGRIPEDEEFWEIDRIRYGAPVLALCVSSDLVATTAEPSVPSVPHQGIDELLELDGLDLVEAVSQVLRTFLPSGAITITGLSKLLGMSARSLQRRLDDAGTTHSRIMRDVRRTMALERLAQANHSIGEIAQQLGYSDSAHFTRAFRRWTGMTPRDFRRVRFQPH